MHGLPGQVEARRAKAEGHTKVPLHEILSQDMRSPRGKILKQLTISRAASPIRNRQGLSGWRMRVLSWAAFSCVLRS